MKSKIKTMITLITTVVISQGMAIAGSGWTDNFEEAKAKAKAENRFMLLDFTGSDWCGWCIKLDKEVFSKEAFKAYAKDNLVLFLADFPQRTAQSDALKEQNQGLAKKYGIQGFPTVLLLKADGTLIEQTGYQRGGPEKYVEHLKGLLTPPRLPSDELLDAQ